MQRRASKEKSDALPERLLTQEVNNTHTREEGKKMENGTIQRPVLKNFAGQP